MNQAIAVTEKKLTITRTINAPREKVFDAWTQPQHIFNWWRCDPNWKTEIAEVDLRVGGKFRFGMQDPEKEHPFVCQGEYRKVERPSSLVYTWQWDEPTEHPGQSLVTIDFVENGDATDLHIVHEGFADSAATEGHSQGWQACLAVFEAFIAG